MSRNWIQAAIDFIDCIGPTDPTDAYYRAMLLLVMNKLELILQQWQQPRTVIFIFVILLSFRLWKEDVIFKLAQISVIGMHHPRTLVCCSLYN